MLSGTGSNRGTKCIPRLARFNPRLALIGFLGPRARTPEQSAAVINRVCAGYYGDDSTLRERLLRSKEQSDLINRQNLL